MSGKIDDSMLIRIKRYSFWQRSDYAGEIWKGSFISTVRSTVHIACEHKRFPVGFFPAEWNKSRETVCVRRLPSTLIRHENRDFRKHFSNRRNLKTPAFVFFDVDWKYSENRAFRKRWRRDNHVISLPECYSNTNKKKTMIVAFLNFSGVVETKNIWSVFIEKPRFKFLRDFLPRNKS